MSRRTQNAERGFALPTAIFLLVILAALGAFMVTFSTVQHITSAQDVLGSRAYQAARAGIEWGIYQASPASCSSACPITPATPGTTLPALPGDLAPFTIVAKCCNTSHGEGSASVTMYQITSTASSGTVGSATYVERELRAMVSK